MELTKIANNYSSILRGIDITGMFKVYSYQQQQRLP
jgi:hypothetical protein